MVNVLFWILAITFIDGLLAFAGALLYFVFSNNIKKILIILVSFTTGALIGGVFFHFLPEAMEKLSDIQTYSVAIFGFFVFFAIEKFLYWHHCHEGECKEHPFTYLLLVGDAIHNFIDGLIIAGSFLISIQTGIITSILVIVHELPQEIGDFGVLIYGGLEKGKALGYNFLSQITSILGGILGFFIFTTKEYVIYLLPFTAGGFIYIVIADLIPEIFKEKNKKKVIINIITILIGIFLLVSAKVLTE